MDTYFGNWRNSSPKGHSIIYSFPAKYSHLIPDKQYVLNFLILQMLFWVNDYCYIEVVDSINT